MAARGAMGHQVGSGVLVEDKELGAGKTCFVVSPIGSRLEPLGSRGRQSYEDNVHMWEEVLQPACETFGLLTIRADKISEAGEIPEQIFTYLRDAELVIADVSHANANVMYELGLRHSRTKITLQIGEFEQLPFDLSTIRTIQFRRSESGLMTLRDELIDALRVALIDGGPTPLRASRVFNDASGPGAADIRLDVQRSAARESEILVEEPAMLEILAEGEAAVGSIAGILELSSAALTEIGRIVEEATARMAEADARHQGFAGRLSITRQLAGPLQVPVGQFDERAVEFYGSVQQMDAMMELVFVRLESGEDDVQEARDFLDSVLALVDVSEQTAVKIAQFRDSAMGLRKMSAALGAVSRSLELSAGRYLEGISITARWRPRIERLTVS